MLHAASRDCRCAPFVNRCRAAPPPTRAAPQQIPTPSRKAAQVSSARSVTARARGEEGSGDAHAASAAAAPRNNPVSHRVQRHMKQPPSSVQGGGKQLRRCRAGKRDDAALLFHAAVAGSYYTAMRGRAGTSCRRQGCNKVTRHDSAPRGGNGRRRMRCNSRQETSSSRQVQAEGGLQGMRVDGGVSMR